MAEREGLLMGRVDGASDYVIVGASHAGLAAVEAVRSIDPKGTITLLTREEGPPYSPTILPYVVEERVSPERARLRSIEDLKRLSISYKSGAEVASVEPGSNRVCLVSGEELEYGKLLLATGAVPAVPPIPGLEKVPFHVLRTLSDAEVLREAMGSAGSALVLGAGLIGMHAAEILSRAGCRVTIVEGLPQVLPGYFDSSAAGYLEKVFNDHGVRVAAGRRVVGVSVSRGRAALSLENGEELVSELLLVAAGVRPAAGCLEGSGIFSDPGVVVDDRMRTGVPDVWAAGDVAQARSFFGGEPSMVPTVWNAVEQGRTAGLDMAGYSEVERFEGSIPAGTSAFFDHRAFSIGLAAETSEGSDLETEEQWRGRGFLRLVFQAGRLVGAAGIDVDQDPGILLQLIRRRVDLSGVRKDFQEEPRAVGRILMSRLWG
ncbi:MAG: NADH-dependent phenylglyoxylate dehydrogenase subunit epsilon [Desulfobacteraceae bacterium]